MRLSINTIKNMLIDLYNKIKRFATKRPKLAIVIAIVVFIALGGGGLFAKKKIEEFTSSKKNDPIFRMFYVDWCPHCKVAKPEFIKCKNTHKGVQFKLINGESDEDAVKAFNVDGYPTFIHTKNGKHTHYEGERTSGAFSKWLTKMA